MFEIDFMVPETAALAAELEKENFTAPWSEQAFLEELTNKDAVFLTAMQGNCLVGVCGMIISFDEADIMNVSVRKENRRQGIAEALLDKIMQIGRERGVQHFTLEVRKNNTPAIRLYEKIGFVCEGIRPGFYSNPTEDAAIYWLRGVSNNYH